MALKVFEFQFDDWNERQYLRHGVTTAEVQSVLDGHPTFVLNAKGHAATHLMIGPTAGGRFLTVPLQLVEPNGGVWRSAVKYFWTMCDG